MESSGSGRDTAWAMSEENVEIFKRGLEPWAMQSVAFARALPPKEKK